MKSLYIKLVLLILLTAGAFVFLGTGIGYLLSDDTKEIARRVVIQTRLKRTFSAIKRYFDDYNSVPAELDNLDDAGYIDKNEIYIYSPDGDNMGKYLYYPNNYGDPNLILLSERVEDIKTMNLRLRNVKQGLVQMKGDGSISFSEGYSEN